MPGGRPRKKEGRKDTTLTIRLTAEEKAALYREAKDRGRRLSEHVRTVVLTSFYDRKKYRDKITRMLGKTGKDREVEPLFTVEEFMGLFDPSARED